MNGTQKGVHWSSCSVVQVSMFGRGLVGVALTSATVVSAKVTIAPGNLSQQSGAAK